MTERVGLREMNGGWAASVGSINALIGDLVQPTTEVARVISAVAEGDFTQKMALEIEGQQVKGEFLRIGTTVNSMVDQLSSFAAEVTRVAKEVGTDGKLGGQADVPEAAGIWRDLTDNVNLLANNLTAQVRNIAEVTTAVASGDLSKKITVDARARCSRSRTPSTRWSISSTASPPRSRASRGGRHRRQAGRPGRGEGRQRHLEGPDRQRQLHGREPDRAGAQHRRGHHRGRERRPVEEDHRRRQGRDPRAQEHHQHDGRSAQHLRRRGHARRARGRHRGQARRPGRGEGRRRHLEGPHRQRQLPGREPDHPGAQHRRGRRPRSRTATCRRRSPSTPRARSSSSRTPSTRWSTARASSPPRSRASPARSAPRASSAARPT